MSAKRRIARIAVTSMIVLLIACGAAMYKALMFKLPPPTGSYAIGTRMLYLRDMSRTNALELTGTTDNEPAGRDIAVQLWYPAAPSGNRFAAYRMRAESTLRATYMSLIKTYSRQDAPMAKGATPWHVLLFNPAWGSRRGQSTALVEELASHGYVVAAIDHPKRTGPVSLPDGRVIQVVADPDVQDEEHTTVDRFETAVGREADKDAADNSFVLDQLALRNEDSRSDLYHRLDTQHAGSIGHSLGGGVAASVCAFDPRVLSAFSMSGFIFGKARETGVRKPFFYITEDLYLPKPEESARLEHAARVDAEADVVGEDFTEWSLRKNGGYMVLLHGANHSSFTDKAFYFPIKRFSGEDATPRARVLLILRSYAVQFFDKTLRGEPAPLLEPSVTKPFPEVSQKYFPGGASAQQP